MLQITIDDYGSGNVLSAQNSFIKVTNDNKIEAKVLISKNLNDIKNSTHIVLPGQGAFSTCMSGLKNTPGLVEELYNFAIIKQKPFLEFVLVCKCLQSIVKKMDYTKAWVDKGSIKILPDNKLKCLTWGGILLIL